MVDTRRLIKALRLNRLSCGIRKPCFGCELMEDCLYYQQNGAKEAADTIEHLEAENAALREQLTGKNKEIERMGLLEMECDNTQLELSNLRLEYESCQALLKNAQDNLACATAERDAAITEIERYTGCQTCKTEDCYNRKGREDCHWQWRGPQKEDGGSET